VLAGYEDLDPSFRVWLLATRQSMYSTVLSNAETRFKDPKLSISLRTKFARTILNLDPTHEPVCRYLMLQKANEGDVVGALKVYNELWNLLRDEYDMEPSDQTVDVLADIKLGNEDQAHSSETQASALRKNDPQNVPNFADDMASLPIINVERFEDAGIPEFMFHLVRGFRHSLIDSVTRFREWKVADDLDLSSGGISLPNVAYTLQGTAYVADDVLNLVLTLKDLNSQILVWSDRFSYNADDWPNIKHRVLSKIAMTLNVELSAKKLSEMLTIGTVSKKTYEQWLFGQSLIMNFNPDSWRQSEEIFRNLTEVAPNFSSAYSSLAQLGNTRHIAQPGVFVSSKERLETLRVAKLSAQLGPFDSRSHLSLAWAYAFSGHFEQSQPHFEMAIELNEFDPWTVISAAQGFAFMGDGERAVHFAEISSEMAFLPSPPYWGYHAGIYFMGGSYDAALASAQKAGDALVNNGIWRAASLLHLGEPERAKAELISCFGLIRQRWVGGHAADVRAICNWMTKLFPIRSASDRARLHEVLNFADERWFSEFDCCASEATHS
jgi:tetratricopeptide (TPR) repeat protein